MTLKKSTAILLVSLLGTPCIAAPFGQISNIVGEASVYSLKRKAWKPARVAQQVHVDDKIRTGKESRLEIKCSNGGVLRISESSHLVVSKPTQLGGSEVCLLRGKIWSNMKKIVAKRRKFSISTPTAVASIRGTVFRVNAGKDSTTDVLVYEGKVEVGPSSSLQKKLGTGAKGERKQVPGPRQISGPKQVTLKTWVALVAGQQISVWNNGECERSQFDQGKDKQMQWVKYNLERDQLLGKGPPKEIEKTPVKDKKIDWEKGWY